MTPSRAFRIPGRLPLSRSARIALWGLVFGVLALKAALTLGYLGRALLVEGPNTTGEAGKVYFAERVQEGRAPFDDGIAPPYYPSVHGVLVHAPVGGLGALLDASVTELYAIGRGISVLLTVFALALVGDLGRRLGLQPALLLAGLLAWVGSFDLIHHTVSYRPDNWLLFLGSLACWLVSTRPDARSSLAVLAVLPAVAFHVKSPGVVVGVAIVGALILQGHRRRAVGLGTVQLVLVLASVLVLEALSDGAYMSGLRAVGNVSASIRNVLFALAPGDPIVPWLVFFPLVSLPMLRRHCVAGSGSLVCSVGVFWAVTTLGYAAASLRSGSNTYYFLEPATYGILIGLVWLSRSGKGKEASDGGSKVPTQVAAVALITVLLASPSTASVLANGRMPDVALFRSEQLGDLRGPLAERLNGAGLQCYSDDPGLNVLLDRPAVIYPLLQKQMIEDGTLDSASLFRPVERREFDCVVLSGVRWSYRNEPVLSDTFLRTIGENYRPDETVGRYTILAPIRGESPTVPPSPLGPRVRRGGDGSGS